MLKLGTKRMKIGLVLTIVVASLFLTMAITTTPVSAGPVKKTYTYYLGYQSYWFGSGTRYYYLEVNTYEMQGEDTYFYNTNIKLYSTTSGWWPPPFNCHGEVQYWEAQYPWIAHWGHDIWVDHEGDLLTFDPSPWSWSYQDGIMLRFDYSIPGYGYGRLTEYWYC